MRKTKEKTNMKSYYLAYGSNLNVKQMKYRCPNAKRVGKAILDGYRLMFKGREDCAYLTIEKDENYQVPLGVWEVDEDDMESLDIYEGYPNFYYRKEFQIELIKDDGNKENINGIAYIMWEKNKLGSPRDFYLQTCLEGYRNFDFDRKYLDEAYLYSIRK